MGLLDKLWDETLAGPRPANGLSKLRKYNTFSPRSSAVKESDGEDLPEKGIRMTRSITIERPSGDPAAVGDSQPPISPFSGTRRNESSGRRRRWSPEVHEKALLHILTTEI